MFGGTPEQLEQARAELEKRQHSQVFEVWPENWRAFQLFAHLDTQWDVVAGLGGVVYMGLKYPSLPEVERRVRVHPDDAPVDDCRVFEQLRTLELEARTHYNARG